MSENAIRDFTGSCSKQKESMPGLPRMTLSSKKIKGAFPLGKCTTRGEGVGWEEKEYITQKTANPL